jgi:hypothetical protein
MKKRIRGLMVMSSLSLLGGCALQGPAASSEVLLSSNPAISSAAVSSSGLKKWQETDCYAYALPQFGKDVMPLGAWCSPVDPYITDSQYATAKASGLNFLTGLYENVPNSPSLVKQALTCAAHNNLAYLVRDLSTTALSEDANSFKSHFDDYAAYSSFGGVLVADEPSKDKFASFVAAPEIVAPIL